MHKLFTPSLLICALSACSTAQPPAESASQTAVAITQSSVKTMAPALQAIVDQSWWIAVS